MHYTRNYGIVRAGNLSLEEANKARLAGDQDGTKGSVWRYNAGKKLG